MERAASDAGRLTAIWQERSLRASPEPPLLHSRGLIPKREISGALAPSCPQTMTGVNPAFTYKGLNVHFPKRIESPFRSLSLDWQDLVSRKSLRWDALVFGLRQFWRRLPSLEAHLEQLWPRKRAC